MINSYEQIISYIYFQIMSNIMEKNKILVKNWSADKFIYKLKLLSIY